MGNEKGGSCWWTCYVPGFVLGGLHICLLIYSVQYPCQGGGIHPTPQMKYKRLRERRLVLSHSWCMAELEFKPSCVQFQSTCFFFFFFFLKKKNKWGLSGVSPI